jgi:flavin-dependent dehydrogenase
MVLGVSVKDADKTQYYYEQFIEYMKKNHGLRIEKQLKVDKWLMPHIRPGCPIDYGVGRVMFAGEIAGFLNPMGEGVSAGMESGYCASMALAGNIDNPEKALDEYRNKVSDLHGYMKRQWELVAGMAGTFKEMG